MRHTLWYKCNICPNIDYKKNGLLLTGQINNISINQNIKFSNIINNSKKPRVVYVNNELNKYYRWSGSPQGSCSTPSNKF